MPLLPYLADLLARLSRMAGLETVDAFPPGHVHAHTHWNRAYFDIASDLKPEQIERTLCDAIHNTPHVFAHISHPTPRMQKTLIAVIESRLRRGSGDAGELAALLVQAYDGVHTQEALPGLRAAIEERRGDDISQRAAALLVFLGEMPAPFDVIEAQPPTKRVLLD